MHYCVVVARWPEYQAPPPSPKEGLILRLDARGRSQSQNGAYTTRD